MNRLELTFALVLRARHIVFCALVMSLCVASTASAQRLPADLQSIRELREAGEYAQAAKALRAVLRTRPDDLAAREELGFVLILDGKYASAQYHFRTLLERHPDPDKRRLYRAVLQRIATDRPFGVSLILRLTPSSNVNSGSSKTEFDTFLGALTISDESRARSGITKTVGLNGFFRVAPSDRDRFQLDWTWAYTDFGDPSVENTDERNARLSYARLTDWGSYGFRLGQAVQRSATERLEEQSRGVFGTLRFGPSRRLAFSADEVDKSYRRSVGNSGSDQFLRLSHEWGLTRGQSVWVGLLFERSRPGLAHQAFDGRVLQFGGRKVLRMGTVIDGFVSLGQRDFSGVFPGVTFDRFDRFEHLTVSVQDSRLNYRGFAPRATCRLKRNGSNISLFESTTQECSLELTHKF